MKASLNVLVLIVILALGLAEVPDKTSEACLTSESKAVAQSTQRTAELRSHQVKELWGGSTVYDLRREYGNIFRRGNRNAASHLWSSFILRRSLQMSSEELKTLFTGFCAVSGSPVNPRDYARYKMTLDHVDGTQSVGFTYYCCWPCVCDTQDFIRVDTLTVPTATGEEEMKFLVIGDPCLDANAKIPWQAPEVTCKDGRLEGATHSDHGFVIISMFFDFDPSLGHQDEVRYANHCKRRADAGYNSGMGEIFREVAGISKVITRDQQGQLCPAKIEFLSDRASSNHEAISE